SPLRATGQLQPVDGDVRIDQGIRAVPTPGHTPGHQSVLIERGGGTLAVTGDLLVHVLQLIDPSLGYSEEDDQALARLSRRNLLQGLTGRAVLATPHLGEPFIDLDSRDG